MHIRWGYYCLGLDRLCPIRLVTCVDDSRTHDLIARQRGIRFFSLDQKTGRRTEGRDSAMNEILPNIRPQLEEALRERSGNYWTVVCPSPCRSITDFAAEAGYESVCHPPPLGHWLNDKANFLAAVIEIGLPRMPGRWVSLPEARYSELAAEMGSTFVAQLARGTSGSGTAFISSEADYVAAGARFGDSSAWAAPDLGDLSLNINAIAMESGVAVGYPSVQLVGLPMLAARRGMYCGNDYAATADLPAPAVHDVVEQTERIGRWLASLGFRGLYGLDYVLDPASSKAHAVDLNPRWQGSTGLLAQAEYEAGRLPLAVVELAYRLGLLGEAEILRHQEDFLGPVTASQISLRCKGIDWSEVTGDVPPGVYSISQDAACLRAGLSLEDLTGPDELLVAGGVPRQGTLLSPGAHIVRIGSKRRVLDVSTLRPLPWSELAAQSLYRALALRSRERIGPKPDQADQEVYPTVTDGRFFHGCSGPRR